MESETAPSPWWVACLCAQWCGVCREWRESFTEEAARRPGMRFAWVDVEEEDDAMGDVDIETFPTVLVARGHQLLFLGPVLPTGHAFARLLETLQSNPTPVPGLDDADRALLVRLAPQVLPRNRVLTR